MIKQPTTLKELKKFRYAVTESLPQGQAYDPAQCAMIVYERKRPKYHWQCSRKSGYGKDGLWCANHKNDPVAMS